MHPPRRFFGTLAVAVALAGAGCGGGSEPADTPSSTATTAVPATAAPTTAAPAASAPASEAPAPTDVVVAVGDTVSVHYVGTLDDGEEFDSSRGRGPLSFVVGSGQMITGFDAAVQGMAIGEVKMVRLPSAEAYGERSDDFIIDVGLDQVPPGTTAGDTLVSQSGQSVTVLAIEGDVVTIDANHPLAGEALTFEIEVIEIES